MVKKRRKLKTRKKPIKIPEEANPIICMYCKNFWKYASIEDEETRSVYRLCKENDNKRIQIDTSICKDHYKPNRFFYCANWCCWLDIVICLRRSKEKHSGCQRCRQFNESVVLVLEKYGSEMNLDQNVLEWLVKEKIVLENLPIKRKLKRRINKAPVVKPKRKLKRRKQK